MFDSGVRGRPTRIVTTPAKRSKAVSSFPVKRHMSGVPKLVAFDLDGTLWWPEMYMLSGSPFKKDKDGRVLDRRGEQVELMGNSHAILTELATNPKWQDTSAVFQSFFPVVGSMLVLLANVIALQAYVSRTEYPSWATACLKLFQVTDKLTAYDIAPYQEIYPGNKTRHFKKIAKDSGIAFEEMLFFDNEWRNCSDVSRLGVTCVYTPDGMTEKVWTEGLKQYASKSS